MKRLVVITAGLSQPSSTRLLADRLAAAAAREIGPDTEVRVVELRDHAHAITDHLLTGFPAPALKDVLDAVAAAAAVIAVSPIFNASYSGLFKSFFVLLGATGGTARHSLALEHALRPMFTYLHAVVAPTAVFAATEDWAAGGDATLHRRIDRAGRDLADLVGRRPSPVVADPFALTTSFDALLSGQGRAVQNDLRL